MIDRTAPLVSDVPPPPGALATGPVSDSIRSGDEDFVGGVPTKTFLGAGVVGWRVVLAGLGVNLALGILYSWSVFSKAIPADWNWSEFEKSLPYSVACLVFCLAMPAAGRLQDRFGPRWTTTIGGLLGGLGLILAAFTISPLGYTVGFGLLTGIGLGLAYASTTPAAVKWFPNRELV